MDEITYSFYYKGSCCSISCKNEVKYSEVFEVLKEKFHLELDNEHYAALTPLITDFDDTTVYQMYQKYKSTEIHVVLKVEYDFIDEFTEETWPSMKLEISMMSVQTLKILKELHIAHILSYQIYFEKSSTDASKILPDSIKNIENLVEKMQSTLKYVSENFIGKDGEFECKVCHNKISEEFTLGRPTGHELELGVYNVEKYPCLNCGATLRVRRFFVFDGVITKKTGNNQELCLFYGAIFYQLGYPVRVIIEPLNTYYWLEIWDPKDKRYIHFDPVNEIVDSPLSVDTVFSKKLNYIIAVGPHECCDVTVRYTKDPVATVNARREILEEEYFQQAIGLRAGMWGYDDEVLERQEIDYFNMAAAL